MTFYEAALRVLESAGKPLNFIEITQRSIEQDLLSHVGKTPEQTMLSRLAAMARRPRDRKVIVTGKDTFALSDWALSEDPDALAEIESTDSPPEANLPSLRPTERHPDSRVENIRVGGRGSERRKWREEEDVTRRKRRPSLAEVVLTVLTESPAALKSEDIIQRAKGQELVGDDLTNEQLLTALLQDNQRRIDAGRRPQFVFHSQTSEISLEKAGTPSEATSLEVQAAFAQALGIPLDAGRPVLPHAPTAETIEEPVPSIASLRLTARDARRAVARSLKQRLAELDLGTFEKSVVRMLHGLGFRDVKAAKRSRDSLLITSRRRDGVTELRYAARLLRGGTSVDRKNVNELRRELGHYSAQVGILISPGDARGDARSEAQSGGGIILLWCGDSLGDKFIEGKAGVTIAHLEVFDIDAGFFEAARIDAEEARRRREERTRERANRGLEDADPAPKASSGGVDGSAAQGPAESDSEGDDGGHPLEGPESNEGTAPHAATPGRPADSRPPVDRQRRRRRRGRRSGALRPPTGVSTTSDRPAEAQAHASEPRMGGPSGPTGSTAPASEPTDSAVGAAEPAAGTGSASAAVEGPGPGHSGSRA